MKKYILILTLTLFFGCSDFLDVKPTGTVIPTTVEDFDKLLNNIEIGGGDTDDADVNYGTWQNVLWMDPDTWFPDFHYSGIWQPIRRRQYNWDPNPYEVQDQDPDWNSGYENINVYNIILGAVDGAPLGNAAESSRNLVKGEALAQRAFDLFLLVNEYAAHYSASTKDDPGIPMPLTSDLAAQLSKSTIGEVYDQIIEDLLAAEVLLANVSPVRAAANFRPGTASIKALLGEVYLYMGDFTKAEAYTEEALGLYDFVHDYLVLENVTPGDAWSSLDNDHEFRYVTDVKSNTWSRRHFSWFYDPAPLYHSDLSTLYDKVGNNDWRFYLFSGNHTYYQPNTILTEYVFIRDFFATNSGMSVPKTILTNAEAKARNGDGPGAIAMLNQLAVYRYLSVGSTFSYTTDAAALQEAKDERRRELCFTGNNFFDLQRYHAYGDVVPTFTRNIPGTGIITLEPGSDKYIVPIPRVVSSVNPNLK